MEQGGQGPELFRKGALEDLAQEFADVYMADKKAAGELYDPAVVENDIVDKLIEAQAAGWDDDEAIMGVADALYPNQPARKRAVLQTFMSRHKHNKLGSDSGYGTGAGKEFGLDNT